MTLLRVFQLNVTLSTREVLRHVRTHRNTAQTGKDGWLILDDDEIPKLSEDEELKEIVDLDKELEKIVAECKRQEMELLSGSRSSQ